MTDSPTNSAYELNPIYNTIGGITPHAIYAPWTGVKVVAIYNVLDLAGGVDYIPGADNRYVATLGNQGSLGKRILDAHDNKAWMAKSVLQSLNVSMDAHGGR